MYHNIMIRNSGELSAYGQFLQSFLLEPKIYVELAGYDRYNGRIETKRRDGL